MIINGYDKLQAQELATAASQNLFLHRKTGNDQALDDAIRAMSDALAIFGRRVEKVLTAQEAHEEMLSRRCAEDKPEQAEVTMGFR